MAVKIIGLLLVLSVVVPFGIYRLSTKKTPRKAKTVLITNISTFFSTLIVSNIMMFSGKVFAADATGSVGVGTGMGYIAAALVTGLSTIGAGIAVAAASSSALGAISEDPKLMGKSLIFVALAEGIALYGLLVTFSILARL